MDAICIERLNGEEMLDFLDLFCTLFINVVRADNPASYMNALDRNAIRSYWENMAISVSNGKSNVLAAFIGSGIFGAVEYRLNKRQGKTCGCSVIKLLVDSRFRREQVTADLLLVVDTEARAAGARPNLPGLYNGEPVEPTGDQPVRRAAGSSPGGKPAGLWLPRKRAGFDLRDEITLVPIKRIRVSADFYRNKLGLRLRSFFYLGDFVDTGAGTLFLRSVENVRPAPWPIAEWFVPDLAWSLTEMRSRNVSIVPNGLYAEDRFGTFAHPDGGKAAIIRDPDGNLLALREPVKRRH
jgi:hypothetical protein